MLKDVEVGVTMERRRQTAVYSPGGCGCGLLLLPVIAVSIGVMFALAGMAAAALVLLIVAAAIASNAVPTVKPMLAGLSFWSSPTY